MKRYIVLCILVFLCLSGYAQQWEKIDPSGEFSQRLERAARQLQSIACDFIQEKYLDVFDEKIISKGRFYFRKENKICLSYSEPLDYLIVINGQKLKVVSDGKVSLVDLGTNKMMDGMNRLLSACMTGNLFLLGEEYQMDYAQQQEEYWVRIKPLNEELKNYLSEMAIYFDRKNMAVKTLRLVENERNYTEYRFVNQEFNTLVNDEKFTIR